MTAPASIVDRPVRELRLRLESEAWSPTSEAENFPPVVDATSWAKCLRRLEQTHEALRATIAREGPDSLDRTLPAGDGTAIDQILGIIQHDLYHAGQVALLIRQQRA